MSLINLVSPHVATEEGMRGDSSCPEARFPGRHQLMLTGAVVVVGVLVTSDIQQDKAGAAACTRQVAGP